VPKNNNQCLSLCNTKHNLDTFCFLLQACEYLLAAVKSGDVNRTKIWAKYASENCTTDDLGNDTPLIIAAKLGVVELVRLLLESGADVDKPNGFQQTALNIAAAKGYLDMCRLLLDWGANVNTLDTSERTPVRNALLNRHLSVAKLLVERGGNIFVTNDDDESASDEVKGGNFRFGSTMPAQINRKIPASSLERDELRTT
jgi:ankyrin repeat protein